MAHHVVLLPNTVIYYPQLVIDAINKHQEVALVLTLDKTHLSTKCPVANLMYRASNEDDYTCLYEEMKRVKPKLVVLDNCFCDARLDLLYELLRLQKTFQYAIMNVFQINSWTYWATTMTSIVDMIHVPTSDIVTRYLHVLPLEKLRYYDNETLHRKFDVSIPI